MMISKCPTFRIPTWSCGGGVRANTQSFQRSPTPWLGHCGEPRARPCLYLSHTGEPERLSFLGCVPKWFSCLLFRPEWNRLFPLQKAQPCLSPWWEKHSADTLPELIELMALSVSSHWTTAEANWSMSNDVCGAQDLVSLISVDKSTGHFLAVVSFFVCFFYFYFFLATPWGIWNLKFPDQGSNLHPLQQKCRVLTAGLPGTPAWQCFNCHGGSD